MKAVGYARVSTDGQVQEGISLDAQQARIHAWCSANGYEMLKVHVDAGISGCRADNRPALQAALRHACDQKAALIVYSLSRFARSTKDAILMSERLARSGADLVSLSERIDTTTAAGKMVFRMLAVLAEFERDQVAERTKAALTHLRQQSKRISRYVPFGYDLAADGITLSPNSDEQAAILLIQSLHEYGHSLREIAAALTSRGIPTKSGRPWSAKVISSIVARSNAPRKAAS